ncbi:MAG: pfkB family carbohydrate kinase [Candidatus Peregrinibacteria bacterium Gr01-1014_25]|nr:MAG: pfkB family carbohydrate kinase [Candidatus Peregrinibacteria bacterium Gr01-1014_25]
MTSPQDARRRPRTLSIGGATFDLFVRCGHRILQEQGGQRSFLLPLGAKVPVDGIIGGCGGGAANTAVGFARLGCDPCVSSVVADDEWGGALLHTLQKEGVRTDCITVVEEETTSFSIIFTTDDGERVIVYDAGTNQHLHDVTFDRERLKDVDWVYLNHLHERSCVIADDLVAALGAAGAPRMTWNPGGSQIRAGMNDAMNRALLGCTSLLLLNKEEALAFTGANTIDDALRAVIAAGVRVACVTDGKHGAVATDGKTLYRCPIAPATPVDATGAGDAFGTGCSWALLTGHDLPTALQAGSINAASVVGVLGAQAGLLTDTEMRARLTDLHLAVDAAPF